MRTVVLVLALFATAVEGGVILLLAALPQAHGPHWSWLMVTSTVMAVLWIWQITGSAADDIVNEVTARLDARLAVREFGPVKPSRSGQNLRN